MSTLQCPHCGQTFRCEPQGNCWCKQLPAALPVPSDAAAVCLCPCQLTPAMKVHTKTASQD